MSMGKGRAPTPPDPYRTASSEAQFNRLDQFSPSGSGSRHGYTDENGEFRQGVAPEGFQSAVKYTESQHEKEIREKLEPASLKLTDRIIDDNIRGMPGAARVRERSDVASDIFQRNLSMMKPEMDQANSRLLTNLQARGIPIGSEAFNDAYGKQQRQTQDTMARMAMDANIAAGQEQSRQFSLSQAQRSSAISELVAAMGGGYNPPNAVPSGSTSNVNYSALVGQQYQQQLAQHNQRQQQAMSAASTIGSIGAGLLMKSTREAKDVLGSVNIHQLAHIIQNLPLHAWSYREGEAPLGDGGKMHIGPMAEDFHAMTGLGSSREIDAIDFFGVIASALQAALQRIEALERSSYPMASEPCGKLRVQ